jgi:uncharacterized protein (AIM24 family)
LWRTFHFVAVGQLKFANFGGLHSFRLAGVLQPLDPSLDASFYRFENERQQLSFFSTKGQSMNRYSIDEFVSHSQQKDHGQGEFELETERILEVNLNGSVWTKMGSMISYRGQIKFVREGILEQGLGNLLKKSLTGEGTRLTKAEGRGQLYLADQGKKIIILRLNNESIFVNGNDLLAFQMSVNYQIKLMRKITGMLAGGMFNVRLQGTGLVAFTSHYDPITLIVTPDNPVTTDPNATIAWSGSLEPQFKTDVSLKTFFGRGSGESIQMHFAGNGFVVVQPFEEVYMQAGA